MIYTNTVVMSQTLTYRRIDVLKWRVLHDRKIRDHGRLESGKGGFSLLSGEGSPIFISAGRNCAFWCIYALYVTSKGPFDTTRKKNNTKRAYTKNVSSIKIRLLGS